MKPEEANATRPESTERSRTLEDVARYIKQMKFKKRLFGGVDEADVWRQIEALHREYEAVFTRQELRSDEHYGKEGEVYSGSTDPPETGVPDG